HEAARWADRLLPLDGEVPPLVRAAALRTRAMCGATTPAGSEVGYRRALESLAICREAGEGHGTGESLHTLACMARWLGRSDEAQAWLDEGVALARAAADAPLLAMLLATYGGLGLSEADDGPH